MFGLAKSHFSSFIARCPLSSLDRTLSMSASCSDCEPLVMIKMSSKLLNLL